MPKQPYDIIIQNIPVASNDQQVLVYDHSVGYFKFSTNGSGSSFSDSSFDVFDDLDNTKIVNFQCSGITASTTRTITIADLDIDMGASYLFADGSVTATGTLNMGTNNINGVAGLNCDSLIVAPSNPTGTPSFTASDIAFLRRMGDATLQIHTGVTDTGAINFTDMNVGRGRMEYDHNTDELSLYSAGTKSFYLNSSGEPFFPNTRTATGGADARFLATGELIAVTSSRRNKKNERALDFDPMDLLGMPSPVMFDWNDRVFVDPDTGEERITKGDTNTWGWIAEDIAMNNKTRRWVINDDAGEPLGVSDGYEMLSVLVEVVKMLNKRIMVLEGRGN